MGAGPRMTMATLRVLRVLLEDPTAKRYGLEVCKAAGLPSGSVYPLLMRLEQAEWLASEWEDVDPVAAGRPRRRLYRLTAKGADAGRRALHDAQRALIPGWGEAPGFSLSRGMPA